jgi:hypothetical protein
VYTLNKAPTFLLSQLAAVQTLHISEVVKVRLMNTGIFCLQDHHHLDYTKANYQGGLKLAARGTNKILCMFSVSNTFVSIF